jgi:hypothetical protein
MILQNHPGDQKRVLVVPGPNRNRNVNAFWHTFAILVAGDLVPQLPLRAGWRECGAMLIEKQLAGAQTYKLPMPLFVSTENAAHLP